MRVTNTPEYRPVTSGLTFEFLIRTNSLFLAVAAAFLGFAPLIIPFLLVLVGALSGAVAWHMRINPFRGMGRKASVITLLVFCAYMLVNATWSADMQKALSKTAFLLIVLIACATFIGHLSHLPDRVVKRHMRDMVIGAFFALGFLLVELLSGLAITRLVINEIPTILPERLKGMTGEAGAIETLSPFLLNKNMAAFDLVLWPVMAMILFVPIMTVRRTGALLLVTGAVTATFYSHSDTAKLAIVAGGMVFAAYRFFPKLIHWSLVSVWCAAVLLAVPLMALPYDFGLHEAKWLPASARERVYLWSYTAEQTYNRPIFGIGIRSTRAGQNQIGQNGVIVVRKDRLTRRPGWHAHNLFLQTWYELGAVGAVLLLAIGLSLLGRLRLMAKPFRPFGYALFSSVFIVAAFGWGMWQSWLIACYAFAWCSLVLATCLSYRQKKKIVT